MSKETENAEKKKKIRSAYLEKRNRMEPKKRREASEKIRVKLLKDKRISVAKTVFAYASYKSEVETKELITELVKRG